MSTCQPFRLSPSLHTCLSACLRLSFLSFLFKRVDVCKSTWQFIYALFSFPPYYISVCMSVYACFLYVSLSLPVCMSIYLLVNLFVCLRVCLPVHLSVEQYVWAALSLSLTINTESSVLWLSPRPGNKAATSNTHKSGLLAKFDFYIHRSHPVSSRQNVLCQGLWSAGMSSVCEHIPWSEQDAITPSATPTKALIVACVKLCKVYKLTSCVNLVNCEEKRLQLEVREPRTSSF